VVADDEPLIMARLTSSGRRLGPPGFAVALYSEIIPHNGMRRAAVQNLSTAANTAPPTFSK
jgi:hypothetical protein